MKVSIPAVSNPQKIQTPSQGGPHSGNRDSDFSAEVENSRTSKSRDSEPPQVERGSEKIAKAKENDKPRADNSVANENVKESARMEETSSVDTDDPKSEKSPEFGVEGADDSQVKDAGSNVIKAELLEGMSVGLEQVVPVTTVPSTNGSDLDGSVGSEKTVSSQAVLAGLTSGKSIAELLMQQGPSSGNFVLGTAAANSGAFQRNFAFNRTALQVGITLPSETASTGASTQNSSAHVSNAQSLSRIDLGMLPNGYLVNAAQKAIGDETGQSNTDLRALNLAQNKMQELVNRMSPMRVDEMVQLKPQSGVGMQQPASTQVPVFAAVAPHMIADVISGSIGTSPTSQGTHLVSSISSQVANAITNKSIELQLVPRSLGIVHVKIVNAQGQLSIALQTTTVEAEQALRAELAPLQEAMRAAGYNVDEMRIVIQQKTEADDQHGYGNFGDTDFASMSGSDESDGAEFDEDTSADENDNAWDNAVDIDPNETGNSDRLRDGLYF